MAATFYVRSVEGECCRIYVNKHWSADSPEPGKIFLCWHVGCTRGALWADALATALEPKPVRVTSKFEYLWLHNLLPASNVKAEWRALHVHVILSRETIVWHVHCDGWMRVELESCADCWLIRIILMPLSGHLLLYFLCYNSSSNVCLCLRAGTTVMWSVMVTVRGIVTPIFQCR